MIVTYYIQVSTLKRVIDSVEVFDFLALLQDSSRRRNDATINEIASDRETDSSS